MKPCFESNKLITSFFLDYFFYSFKLCVNMLNVLNEVWVNGNTPLRALFTGLCWNCVVSIHPS